MTHEGCPYLLECSKALSIIGKYEVPKQRVDKINKVCVICFVPEFYGYNK
jgi:hypothetical protein